MSQDFQGRSLHPRQTDRRKVSVLRRVPLIGGLGLVLNDRRSYRERRKSTRNPYLSPPCALLRLPEQSSQDLSLFRGVGLHWHRRSASLPEGRQELPWLLRWRRTGGQTQSGLAAWIRRCLHYPWRRS